AGIAAQVFAGDSLGGATHHALDEPFFKTRGVVLLPTDFAEVDWPRLTSDAGLNRIGIHGTPSSVSEFISSERGMRMLAACQAAGLGVEYELHAISDLLPRSLFERHPEMFRMNQDGDRVSDFNCCPASREGLQVICENAVKYAQQLHPTTHRYFYWLDDVAPTCRCPQCVRYSDSEQAIIVENAMLQALRQWDRDASLSHLAYVGTLGAPKQIPPDPGLFLEFAPIERSWAHPLSDRNVIGRSGAGREKRSHGQTLDLLDANLDVFPRETAQVLEYWLDASLHSKWTRPSREVPWNLEVLQSDLVTYGQRGIWNITTFAAWIDRDYVNRFGPPDFVSAYGAALLAARPEPGA
ncbi:MAG: DUF4838 domain-containing protein, partial [Planctomycetaceae bacterium]